MTASEPVFGYMAEALGLNMRNEKFQLAVMNNTEPSVSYVAAFEDDLKGHKVRVMLFNAQASEPAVQRLVKIAEAEKNSGRRHHRNGAGGQDLSRLDALPARFPLDKALAGRTQWRRFPAKTSA